MPANWEVSANASGSGAFYRIPNEILALIVGYFGSEGARDRIWHDFSLLKALRLAHQRFADLGFINAILFYDVRLEATQAGLARIRRDDLSRIGGYVHTVTFVTPLSWALPFEMFSEIVTYEALTQRVLEAGDKLGGKKARLYTSRLSGKRAQEKLVNEHLGGQWPFSETQLRDGFAAYMREAEATKALLEDSDGEPAEAWVNALRKLGAKVRKIRFRSFRCERRDDPSDYTSFNDPEPSCRLGPHNHSWGGAVYSYGCERAGAVAGDLVFARAMSCLATSGTKVRELTIRLNVTGKFAWEKAIPGWEKLDLSSLEELKFCPLTPMTHPSLVTKSLMELLPSPKEGEVLPRAQEALHALIKKSHGSLRHVYICEGPMSWPDRSPENLDMPALEQLELGDVHPTLLGEWMARMPRLRRLKLEGSHTPRDVQYAAWADVFDAVRDHPNVAGPDAPGMKVHFQQICTCDWTEIGYRGVVRRNRDESVDVKSLMAEKGDEEDCEKNDPGRALDLHWVYGVPYRKNRVLRYWLQDEDEDDDTDSEEDGDEDEYDEEDGDDGDEDQGMEYQSEKQDESGDSKMGEVEGSSQA
ncbi:hypothetical protein ACJ41O_000489 [Fusarium nematophilum]